MRKIIYICGITASGKTTIANDLSKHMDLPVLSADDVYSMIARELKIDRADKLVIPGNTKGINNFNELKEKYYRALLDGVNGDFIIEGFTLGFKSERELINKILGKHKSTFFYLDIDFATWEVFTEKKYGKAAHYDNYLKWKNYFEQPEIFYKVHDYKTLFVHAHEYQRIGFTDEKIKRLELPNGMLKEKVVADLGCNAGWLGEHCLKAGALSVDGWDNNWMYAEMAKDKGTKVHIGELDDIIFDKQYDIIFCLSTFHYVKDKEALLKKISENTKEVFILEVPIPKSEGMCLELYKSGNLELYIPSMKLLDKWLNKYFKSYERRESIAPDTSTRYSFRCYK